MARTIRQAIVPALALGALLAGCSANPGTAAVIDGEEMSEREAQELAAELTGTLAQEISTVQAVVASAQSDAILQAAAESGASVPRAEVVTQLEDLAAQSGYDPGPDGFLEETVTIVNGLMVQGTLTEDPDAAARYTELVSQTEVELNPRYGTWDGMQVVAPAHPWLYQNEVVEEIPTQP